MPIPLSPSSSQEIISISPPPATQGSKYRGKRKLDPGCTTLPKPDPVSLPLELRERVAKRLKDQRRVEESQAGVSRVKGKEKQKERDETEGMSRSRVIERMMGSLGNKVNPITNSDLYSRTDHFVSAATGHQQSNRGGGSAGAATYWEVRTAKMAEQAREKKTDILKGCVFYINGSTGPKLSNLQLQQMITANGARFTPMQSSSCTHIIANGGLSGSKTQKWIDGQGSRGCAKRMKVVRVEWVLDSVDRGVRLSEAGYGVIDNPSQKTLFSAFGVQPKKEASDSSK